MWTIACSYVQELRAPWQQWSILLYGRCKCPHCLAGVISNVFTFLYCGIHDLPITVASRQEVATEERNYLLFTVWISCKVTYDTLYSYQNGADFSGGCWAVKGSIRIPNCEHFLQHWIVRLYCARISHCLVGCTQSSAERQTLVVLAPRTWGLVQAMEEKDRAVSRNHRFTLATYAQSALYLRSPVRERTVLSKRPVWRPVKVACWSGIAVTFKGLKQLWNSF